jgi:hypothetical protein
MITVLRTFMMAFIDYSTNIEVLRTFGITLIEYGFLRIYKRFYFKILSTLTKKFFDNIIHIRHL